MDCETGNDRDAMPVLARETGGAKDCETGETETQAAAAAGTGGGPMQGRDRG